MAPLVVPNVCRFSVVQSFEGEPVVNIVDMQVDTTGTPQSRADAIYEIAGDILNNWDDHILEYQTDNLTALRVDYMDLNSLDGVTGSRSTTSDKTWPAAGPTVASSFPGMVALRVDKVVGGNRQTRNGRMYLAGITESATEDSPANQFSATFVSNMQGVIDDFLEGINDYEGSEFPLDRQQRLVVVHTVDGVGNGYTVVDRLVVRSQVASQVRRTRRG